MTTTMPQRWEVARRRGWAGATLLGLLLFVAVAAVYGGVGLVSDGMGMPLEWLDRLPVDTWVWPGIALLATVAVPQAVAAWFVWACSRVSPSCCGSSSSWCCSGGTSSCSR